MKTKEEILEQVSGLSIDFIKEHHDSVSFKEYLDSMEEYTQQFRLIPRWISVKDRLPDKLPAGQYVTLLVVYNGKVTTASWLSDKFCLSHNGCSDIQPTHWSYMVEPPDIIDN
jgi:hypothetical protein